jgi:hypothetical protein
MPTQTSRVRKPSASKRSAPSKQRPTKTTDLDKPANVRDETHEPNEVETRSVTKAEAAFIDNEPGYSAEQLDQMAGYYGTAKQGVGEVVTIEPTHLAGQDDAAE